MLKLLPNWGIDKALAMCYSIYRDRKEEREMTEKKNPDYELSAVNLINPPEVGALLVQLHDLQAKAKKYEESLQDTVAYQDLQLCLGAISALTGHIKKMIDERGSYQDVQHGVYGVKQRKESISYKANLVRDWLDNKFARLVIVEAVDVKALDGLVKGKLVTEDQAKLCGEVKESFAFIIR